MAKREKQEHKGYINYVSPKKKTTIGGCHFDIDLQNSSSTPVKVKMFGDDNHRKATSCCEQKSPVKMKMSWNERYRNYQLQDRDSIQKCNTMEVDFPPNDLPGTSGALNTTGVIKRDRLQIIV